MKKFGILILLISIQTNAQINKQERSMWCWASCIQSIMYQYNVNCSQSYIVSINTGKVEDRASNAIEIDDILKKNNFNSRIINWPANQTEIQNTLFDGWKIIAFVNPTNNINIGHFIVLQGISNNGLIVVSDPADGRTYEQSLKSLYYNWHWSSSVIVRSY